MTLTLIQAKAKLRAATDAGLAIAQSRSMPYAQQIALLDPIELDIKKWSAEVRSLEYVEQKKASFGHGGMLDMGAARGAGTGLSSPGRPHAAAPSLDLDEDQIQALFRSAKSAQNFRLETKDASSDTNLSQPPSLMPGIVDHRHEQVRLLEHLITTSMPGPSIEFISHTSTSGGAATVAPGGLKPVATLTTVASILTARKIAVVSGVVDELLEDYAAFAQYIQLELRRIIVDEENAQILSGSGTGDDLLGLLLTSGILTRAKGTDTGLDALEQAMTDLRTGPSFTAADAVVLNPTTWSSLRRTKDTQGRYILNPDPSAEEANTLWGVPVLPTTTMPAGTGIVANLGIAATAFIRRGLSVDSTQNNTDDFQRNRTQFRAEERLTLGVQRPSAICKVTGL